MKISNIKHIKNFATLDVFLICILFISLIFPHKLYWNFAVLILIAILCTILLQIRYIEIDDSGSCFTVRKIHPFAKKGYFPPIVEFPYCAIRHYNIEKGFISKRITIKIQASGMKKNIRLNLLLFNMKQINQLRTFFDKI